MSMAGCPILAVLVDAKVGLGFEFSEIRSGAGDRNRTHVHLLKILGFSYGFASICVQLQTFRETVHRFLCESDMGVSHGHAEIGVAELLLRDLNTVAQVGHHRSNSMTEGMEPANHHGSVR